MIEEIGTVRSTEGNMAVVAVPRKSACEGCTAGTCKPDEQAMEIEALNRAGAVAGQKVRVSIRSFVYMKGSAIVYGVPAVGLVVGAFIGKDLLSGFFQGVDPDILSALCGFAAFGISLALVKVWSGRAGKNIESKPVIEEILS
ncbi:MAG: SoxR reducing system RseC family protein [Thermodesulfovibrionales bacterium]